MPKCPPCPPSFSDVISDIGSLFDPHIDKDTHEGESALVARLYREVWGGANPNDFQAVFPDAFAVATIGSRSYHSQVYVQPQGINTPFLLSVDVPLIGAFKGPVLITGASRISGPMEVIFYRTEPHELNTKRAPVRQAWFGATSFERLYVDTLGAGAMWIAGRKRWRVCINSALGVTIKYRFLYKYGTGQAQAISSRADAFLRDAQGNGQIIDSRYANLPEAAGADVLQLIDAGTNSQYVVPAGDFLLMEAEDE